MSRQPNMPEIVEEKLRPQFGVVIQEITRRDNSAECLDDSLSLFVRGATTNHAIVRNDILQNERSRERKMTSE